MGPTSVRNWRARMWVFAVHATAEGGGRFVCCGCMQAARPDNTPTLDTLFAGSSPFLLGLVVAPVGRLHRERSAVTVTPDKSHNRTWKACCLTFWGILRLCPWCCGE